MLLKYYTEELAGMVTEIYREDFRIFGYPTWDGKPNTLKVV